MAKGAIFVPCMRISFTISFFSGTPISFKPFSSFKKVSLKISLIMDTPLLITFWKRPDKLEKLIASIRVNKPKKIYLASDGPRIDIPNDAPYISKSCF